MCSAAAPISLSHIRPLAPLIRAAIRDPPRSKKGTSWNLPCEPRYIASRRLGARRLDGPHTSPESSSHGAAVLNDAPKVLAIFRLFFAHTAPGLRLLLLFRSSNFPPLYLSTVRCLSAYSRPSPSPPIARVNEPAEPEFLVSLPLFFKSKESAHNSHIGSETTISTSPAMWLSSRRSRIKDLQPQMHAIDCGFTCNLHNLEETDKAATQIACLVARSLVFSHPCAKAAPRRLGCCSPPAVHPRILKFFSLCTVCCHALDILNSESVVHRDVMARRGLNLALFLTLFFETPVKQVV